MPRARVETPYGRKNIRFVTAEVVFATVEIALVTVEIALYFGIDSPF